MIELLETNDITIRPDDIVRALNLKDIEEASKLFNLAYAWLVGLQTGSKLETTFVVFHKVDEDTLFIEKKQTHKELITTMHDIGAVTVIG